MPVPNLWRTKRQRYALQGIVCSTCEATVFPPREVCPYCHAAMHGVAAVARPMLVAPLSYTMPRAAMAKIAGDD